MGGGICDCYLSARIKKRAFYSSRLCLRPVSSTAFLNRCQALSASARMLGHVSLFIRHTHRKVVVRCFSGNHGSAFGGLPFVNTFETLTTRSSCAWSQALGLTQHITQLLWHCLRSGVWPTGGLTWANARSARLQLEQKVLLARDARYIMLVARDTSI